MTAETVYKPHEMWENQGLFATPKNIKELMQHPLIKQNHDLGTVTCTMMMYNVMVKEINKVITSYNSVLEEIKTSKIGNSPS